MPAVVQTREDTPWYYQEDSATNAALEAADFSYGMGDLSLPPEEQDPVVVTVQKRKQYENSNYPMMTWMEYRDEYLDEMLRLEGRGAAISHTRCASCEEDSPLFRCANQVCHGPEMFCVACIIKSHACLPTHWIEASLFSYSKTSLNEVWLQKWNGEYFDRLSLYDLGLVTQLGHPPGYSCPTARAAHKDFVVIDVTGIHNVRVQFCECDSHVKHRQQLMRVRWWPATVKDPQTCATFAVLKLFQIMNCLGKVSAYDFVRSLELLTNNDGLTPPPDRRRSFRHIVRQYRMLLMMKRAGREHSPSGVHGTAQGKLALRCRACPQDGRNLPDGWNNINWDAMPEDLRYKYFLFLAQDCNFRLINRDVSTATQDPIVDDGLGYFVNHAKYTRFLRDHVSEEEISSCSGFQAMFLANRKRVKGLRTTGVGGVTCARHNMWRPNGIGDLQLGERYCNMDFILFSAILNTIIFYLILSYDIACQYSKKLWTRLPGLPAELRVEIPHDHVWFKVPNFHLPPHKKPCHSLFSFHWMWGAGRTHGETVEQNWEFTNGAAASTKMMGPGTRHATLEDLFGFHNWRRLVAWRGIFARRMKENVTEGQTHRDAFDAFNAALEEKVPELVVKWKEWVHKWESEQHTDGAASPFETQEKVTTMKEIRLKLAKEELLHSGEGVEVEREDTPSTFIMMGLEIEESQRHLAVDVKAITNPTPQQDHDFLKRRTAIRKRILAFRKLQQTYMLNVRKFLTQLQRVLWDSDGDRDAEAIRLFLPSDIADSTKRVKACAEGLPEVESSLWEGEVHDALKSLRQGLRVRTMTNRFRLRNATGQRALTRGQGILRQNNVKIHKAKLRYRYARNALCRVTWGTEDDICALNERTVLNEERAQWEAVHDLRDVEEGGVAEYGVVALGEGRRTLSWIWYTAKGGEPTELELVEALRVEWCKAYARMRRWHEDVVLVEEEMRRTIQYGYWEAGQWLERSVARESEGDAVLQEGRKAYALEQAHREAKNMRSAQSQMGVLARVRNALLPQEEDVPHSDREDDGEEGPPDYEGEDEDEDALE
ncbi:CxC2 domain-containing protein [Mycena sanguinolenta]|uniref:CxC2 domain-containing protein n=1 Tax=Mycena sanguinolenta TaxID=230812 RepID=A0A8H6YZ59_9AGAR|nr:CxC2 domain-containing protein [Mycena sanguinolenta]